VIADRSIQELLIFPSPDKNKQLLSALNPQQSQ